MGHYCETLTGTGKDRAEAEAAAIDDFQYENGHRHSYRGTDSARLLRKAPPKKWVQDDAKTAAAGGRANYMKQVDDAAAPPGEWLEVWEFVIHFHA